MPASIDCARAGVTTGEWSQVLRDVFGEYRAPTGIDVSGGSAGDAESLAAIQERVVSTGDALGRPLRLLVGKPGLDGHSNGAEQIAVKGRDAGFEIIYEGIRLTPAQIAAAVGPSGPNAEYLFNLCDAIRSIEVDDPHVFELEEAVRAIMEASGEVRPESPGDA